MNEGMNRQDILDRLRENESALRAHGVTHAALFGSVARGEQRPDSDIDILVDLDPAIIVTMFDYAGLKDYIAGLFKGSVDVVDREALKPRVRPQGYRRRHLCFLKLIEARWRTCTITSPARCASCMASISRASLTTIRAFTPPRAASKLSPRRRGGSRPLSRNGFPKFLEGCRRFREHLPSQLRGCLGTPNLADDP